MFEHISSDPADLRRRVTISVKEFCQLSGMGKTKANELIRNGQLYATRVGRRTLISYQSALALIAPCEHDLYVESLTTLLRPIGPSQTEEAK
jgi:excisionase family DNA binding protein